MPDTFAVLGMQWAWLAPAVGVGAFCAIVAFGRRLPGQGAYLSIAAIGFSFLLFWFVLHDLLFHDARLFDVPWFTAGDVTFRLSMTVDSISVTMMGVVTAVALAVQVYSLGYMKGDARFGWYFAVHSLFAAAMLGLVLANNFLVLYVAWELVGLCSYLLIGHDYQRRAAAEAAKKAFVTTRIGDIGLLIAILVLYKATGTFTMFGGTGAPGVFDKVAAGQVGSGTVTAAAVLLFMGAMGKSAQFPLHVWLPDAMEGPTPVSALIHAATMVVAGVYLVARSMVLFEHSQAAAWLVTSIGLVTALIGASMALVMSDIKKVLAYSTMSQIGFMMVALGLGNVTAAMFHLGAHAFFKSLLFLSAGSVLHGAHTQELGQMGGLRKAMPWTAALFALGALALAGVPPLSGFWSKDEILSVSWFDGNPAVFVVIAVTAVLSAVYMARVTLLAFSGTPRNDHVFAHAHESPTVMLAPMLALAVPAALLGFGIFNWAGPLFHLPDPLQGFGTFVFNVRPEEYLFRPGVATVSIVAALAGLFMGWAYYAPARLWSVEAIRQRFAWLHRLLVNKYYLDDLYQWTIDHVVMTLGRVVAIFDREVVNNLGVDETGKTVARTGLAWRFHETGLVSNYVAVIAISAAIILVTVAVVK